MRGAENLNHDLCWRLPLGPIPTTPESFLSGVELVFK